MPLTKEDLTALLVAVGLLFFPRARMVAGALAKER
jgi:hypothetical protein